MYTEFTGIMPDLPPGKTSRNGQLIAWKLIQEQKSVNGCLPTGYGKTLTIDGCYDVLKKTGECNRMLIVFPRTAQYEQYKRDHPEINLINIGFWGIEAEKWHKQNKHDIFFVTIQALIQSGTYGIIIRMMEKCNWFLAIDEYHHYGEDKTWGMKAANLPYTKRICLSATPYRKEDDSAFGKPDFQISYIDAYKEGVVKDLKAHQYEYVLELLNEDDGKITEINTSEFEREFGEGKEAEKIMIERKMRFSAKYMRPLVTLPIERLLSQRAAKPYIKNQTLIFCVNVLHAKIVSEQIKKLHPELITEWVGNGIDVKRDDNGEIIQKFKNKEIDILCNYDMAGEGIDVKNITEVIFLKDVGMNNTTKQQIGRGSRVIYINDKIVEDVCCTINFDTSCELAIGNYWDGDFKTIMDYNGEEIIIPGPPLPPADPEPYEPLPDEPQIIITNIRLNKVYTAEDSEVQTWAQAVHHHLNINHEELKEIIKDLKDPRWEMFEQSYEAFNKRRINGFSAEEEILQLNSAVNAAASKITGLAAKEIYSDQPVDALLIGKIKSAINARKKFEIGSINNRSKESLLEHYKWIKRLETIILNGNIPSWLRLLKVMKFPQ